MEALEVAVIGTGWCGGIRSETLARSALVESIAQFTRALEQIATLPGTPMLRREQIRLQVALITPLIHVKGYAAAETKAAADRAQAPFRGVCARSIS